MTHIAQNKTKIAAAMGLFTNAIYEQIELALLDTPAAKSFCLLKFNLPGQGSSEYCYFEGVPIVLMLQGPKSQVTGKPDPALLPGRKTVIELVNFKLSEDKGVLGDWGVRLLFNRADRTLQIFAAHLDYASEFLKKEAELAPRAIIKASRRPEAVEKIDLSETCVVGLTMTLTEYRAMKAREKTGAAAAEGAESAQSAESAESAQELADPQLAAAISESLMPWEEQKRKRKRKNFSTN